MSFIFRFIFRGLFSKLSHDHNTDHNDQNRYKDSCHSLPHNIQCRKYGIHIHSSKHIFPPLAYSKLVTRLITIPPAITEAICPDTLAPAACINIILPGSSSCAILWMSLQDIGNAEIPAPPIIGLIFFFKYRFSTFANMTPPMVSMTKAKSPISIMMTVCTVTNCSACILNEMVMPKSSVIRFARWFCAVSDMVPSTPHSRIRLPNIKKPTSATACGAMSPTIIETTIGKAIRIFLLTDCGL